MMPPRLDGTSDGGLLRHTGGVTRDEPIGAGHRVQSHRPNLAPQAPASGGARVAHKPAGAMEHLPERDPAECGVDEVVQRGMVRFAKVLPGAATERGHGRRLVEAQAIGATGRVVVIALVGVADLVDREIVQVPDPSVLHVRPPRLGRDSRGDLAAYQIRGPVGDVDDRDLEERLADAPLRTALALPSLEAGGRFLAAGHRSRPARRVS